MDIDHYSVVLGLNYGEEASNLSKKEISKAYRLKALELHPDKRPNDPNAHANFHNLKTSYQILMDDNARKRLDDSLRHRQRPHDDNAKRRKTMSDLEARERKTKEQDEERIARKLKEEMVRKQIAKIKEEIVRNRMSYAMKTKTNKVSCVIHGKVLKVKWEKVGVNYTAERLRELFSEIGEVEDVMIRSYCVKRWSAIVVMASENEALLVCQCMVGDLSNPLSIMPTELSPRLSKLVGSRYKAFEDSVLYKKK